MTVFLCWLQRYTEHHGPVNGKKLLLRERQSVAENESAFLHAASVRTPEAETFFTANRL